MSVRALVFVGAMLALAWPASAQNFNQAIVFGDSSVDSGAYKGLASPGGGAAYNAGLWPTCRWPERGSASRRARPGLMDTLEAQRQCRPPGTGKLAPHRDFLLGRLEETPAIPMPEIVAELDARHGVALDPASLSRFLCKAGLTYKKNPAGRGARTLRRRQAP